MNRQPFSGMLEAEVTYPGLCLLPPREPYGSETRANGQDRKPV